MFDWDDLRIFLAAARARSFGSAAGRLTIDTATVARRVARLESALKSTLFVRSRQGLQLTAGGAQLMAAALDAEQAMAVAAAVGETDPIGGTVRISASEGFGSAVLAPALPGLLAARPGLRVELAAHAGFLSPSTREVDMAITLSPPEGQRLVVEPLTDYQLALYASPNYLSAAGAPEDAGDLRRHPIVGYVDDLLYAAELRYLDEIAAGLRPVLASSSIQAQRAIIAAGGGVGVLPCFLGEGLVRVLPGVLLKRRFWLSTHREVRATARIRGVSTWLEQLVEARRPLLSPY